MSKEEALYRTMVELADTLVAEFDVVELLTLLTDRCVEVLDVGAAGLMLVSPGGDLRVMASSSEAAKVLELYELQAREGPSLDCYRSGNAVANPDLTSSPNRWPLFAQAALSGGFRSVQALPMRLRGSVLGSLSLLNIEVGSMSASDIAAAQALADVATIGVLQHRAAQEAVLLTAQLNHALHSRVVIEQAKGVIAERQEIGMDEAFSTLRFYARSHNLRLIDVAERVISGEITSLLAAPDNDGRRPSPLVE